MRSFRLMIASERLPLPELRNHTAGGGIRDELSIAACDELGIAMIFTGMRHFKHS
jgi:hypothetical protein